MLSGADPDQALERSRRARTTGFGCWSAASGRAAFRKQRETWDAWWPDLGPSRALLDEFHGKHGAPISWERYATRYLAEMGGAQQLWRIRDLARRRGGRRGDHAALLVRLHDPARCHRTLLARFVESGAARRPPLCD